MSSWESIKNTIEDNGDISTFSMIELRDAAGKEKLGVNVRAEISKTLAGLGVGHIPKELPSYQHETVRLYKRGTVVGDFVEKVLTPGEQNDRFIREQLNESDARNIEIIEAIRELVSE